MAALTQRLTRALDARRLKGARLGPWKIEIRRDLRTPMEDGVELLGDDAGARADTPDPDAAPEPARKRKTAA